jgi:SAM-dependent methyltransferase
MSDSDYEYVGEELDLFRHARVWKSYLRSKIAPFLSGDVLEVGAGIGGTTRLFAGAPTRSWVCLEPDRRLADRLVADLRADALSRAPEVLVGDTTMFGNDRRFDAIIYIDVLEHIEDDRGETQRAAGLLRPGGRLIVLAPAHQWLFTDFDRAIGHYRRYTRASLSAVRPSGTDVAWLGYLDTVGVLASLGNRLLMQKSMPTRQQIAFWDSWMVPVSRVIDPLVAHRLGKSVLAVWRKR